MRACLIGLAVALSSCISAPLVRVEAWFSVADAVWFEEEQTLFFFWEVQAEQGLNEQSVVEVLYTNDVSDWTAVEDLVSVHTHEPVACGAGVWCGSASVRVPTEPSNVSMRLRYHRDRDLAVDATTLYNVVGSGAAWSHRSLLVYGVFDETNTAVQWRARHNFPMLRNEDVERFGLRRYFSVDDAVAGTADLTTRNNLYGYGVACPDDFEPTRPLAVETTDRAVFQPGVLSADSADAAVVCAQVTVLDGTDKFTTGAIARKNPEVRPAFPRLNSPVDDATPLQFLVGRCGGDPGLLAHEAMQRQRLLLGNVPTTCVANTSEPFAAERLTATFQQAVDEARPRGDDMVLVVGINDDSEALAGLVEQALGAVLPRERHRSSPRVAGAFVFDSSSRGLSDTSLSETTLWCPSSDGRGGDAVSCPPQPDTPDVDVGPVQLSELPILPDREDYLAFLDAFTAEQGGSVQSLTFRVPRFATTTTHRDAGSFGVLTFLNQESVAADPDDAFSYCAQVQPVPVVFSSETLRDSAEMRAVRLACHAEELPSEICDALISGAVGPAGLPAWHALFGDVDYDVGVYWEFPFLLRMEYRAGPAATAALLGMTVPFGAASPHDSYFGAEAWLASEFTLERALLQCRRFCDHPTFDNAGVYLPSVTFRSDYANACYSPVFPTEDDDGFPLDP